MNCSTISHSSSSPLKRQKAKNPCKWKQAHGNVSSTSSSSEDNKSDQESAHVKTILLPSPSSHTQKHADPRSRTATTTTTQQQQQPKKNEETEKDVKDSKGGMVAASQLEEREVVLQTQTQKEEVEKAADSNNNSIINDSNDNSNNNNSEANGLSLTQVNALKAIISYRSNPGLAVYAVSQDMRALTEAQPLQVSRTCAYEGQQRQQQQQQQQSFSFPSTTQEEKEVTEARRIEAKDADLYKNKKPSTEQDEKAAQQKAVTMSMTQRAKAQQKDVYTVFPANGMVRLLTPREMQKLKNARRQSQPPTDDWEEDAGAHTLYLSPHEQADKTYVDCVLNVRDVPRALKAVWWLQHAGIRSLRLSGAATLTQKGLHTILAALLATRALTPSGTPLPEVLEELYFTEDEDSEPVVAATLSMQQDIALTDADLSLLGTLQHLRHLHLGRSRAITTLQGLQTLTQLESFTLTNANITTVAPLANCRRLRHLCLSHNYKLTSLKGLEQMELLREVDLTFCAITDLRPLAASAGAGLRALRLNGCNALRSLKGLEGSRRLHRLEMSGCRVSDLQPVLGNQQLRHWVGSSCPLSPLELETFLAAVGATLRSIHLAFSPAVADLRPFAPCTQLRLLVLTSSACLRSLAGIGALRQLEELQANNTPLRDLQPLAAEMEEGKGKQPHRLRKVHLSNCHELSSLDGLQGIATTLEWLDASSTPITHVQALRDAHQLQGLFLSYCHALASLEGLEEHVRLETVELTSAGALASIEPLARCRALRQLTLWDCRRVTALPTGCAFPYLELLNLNDTGITDLTPLLNARVPLRYLERLFISGCRGLTSVRGLEQLTALRVLNMEDTGVADLQPLLRCTALRQLYAGRCPQLHTLAGLEGARDALVELELQGTPVTDLTVLGTFTRLEVLDLRRAATAPPCALAPLRALPCLRRLVVAPTSRAWVARELQPPAVSSPATSRPKPQRQLQPSRTKRTVTAAEPEYTFQIEYEELSEEDEFSYDEDTFGDDADMDV